MTNKSAAPPLSNEDLTRLSYLLADIVVTPALTDRFLHVTRQGRTPVFDGMCHAIQTGITAAADGGVPKRATLRDAAERMEESPEPVTATAGRMLRNMLELKTGMK